jgi:hypothetical protein
MAEAEADNTERKQSRRAHGTMANAVQCRAYGVVVYEIIVVDSGWEYEQGFVTSERYYDLAFPFRKSTARRPWGTLFAAEME